MLTRKERLGMGSFKKDAKKHRELLRSLDSIVILIEECIKAKDVALAVRLLGEHSRMIVRLVNLIDTDIEKFEYYFKSEHPNSLIGDGDYEMPHYPDHVYNFYDSALRSSVENSFKVTGSIIGTINRTLLLINKLYAEIVARYVHDKSKPFSPYVGEIELLIIKLVQICSGFPYLITKSDPNLEGLFIRSNADWYSNIFNRPFEFVYGRLLDHYSFILMQRLEVIIKKGFIDEFFAIIHNFSIQSFRYNVFNSTFLGTIVSYNDQKKYKLMNSGLGIELFSLYSLNDLHTYFKLLDDHFKTFNDEYKEEVKNKIKTSATLVYYYNCFTVSIIHVGSFLILEKKHDVVNVWIDRYVDPKNVTSISSKNLFPSRRQLLYLFLNLDDIRNLHPFHWNYASKEYYVDEMFVIMMAKDESFIGNLMGWVNNHAKRKTLSVIDYYIRLMKDAIGRIKNFENAVYVEKLRFNILETGLDSVTSVIVAKQDGPVERDLLKSKWFVNSVKLWIYKRIGIIAIYRKFSLLNQKEKSNLKTIQHSEYLFREDFLSDDDITGNFSTDLNVQISVFYQNALMNLTREFLNKIENLLEKRHFTTNEASDFLTENLTPEHIIISNRANFGHGLLKYEDIEYNTGKSLYTAKWKPKNVEIFNMGGFYSGRFLLVLNSSKMGAIQCYLNKFDFVDATDVPKNIKVSCEIKYNFDLEDIVGYFISLA